MTPTQHFTEPPSRYTEASLIKALEENGIGRPSTYAAIISTIIDRGYVTVRERRLHPEPVGEVVTDLLVEHFGEFVDVGFTARMEEGLDEVARGERDWVPLLRDFYVPLRDLVAVKRRDLRRRDFTTEASDEVCSLGHPMVIRLGRYGRFLACSLYPEHQETRPLPDDEASGIGGAAAGSTSAASGRPGVGETCPECGEGTLVEKRGRFGPFVGCSRYPECRYIKKDGPPPPTPLGFDVACPKCEQGRLTTKRARRTGRLFWGCSRYPKCDYTTNFEPVGLLHDADAGPVARRDAGALCLRCGAAIELPAEIVVGTAVPGGPPDPGALARPARAPRSARGGHAAPGVRGDAAGRSAGGGIRARRSASRGGSSAPPA